MPTGCRFETIGRVFGWNERPVASITDDEAAIVLHDLAVRRGKKANANQTKHIERLRSLLAVIRPTQTERLARLQVAADAATAAQSAYRDEADAYQRIVKADVDATELGKEILAM